MVHSKQPKRSGFTMAELVVVIAIIGIMAALLLPVIQMVREAAATAHCTNHLREIGMALHGYQDSHFRFPVDDDGYNDGPPYGVDPWNANMTVYSAILPYIESTPRYVLVIQSDPNVVSSNGQLAAYRIYLCPARRDISIGPRGDYGLGHHVDDYRHNGWYSILAGKFRDKQGVSLKEITEADGASNTLMLTHKAMDPRNYDGSGPNDEGWAWLGNTDEHKRNPFKLVPDYQGDAFEYLGSPHAKAAPSLYADGSVRAVAYDIDERILPMLWSWNDGQTIPSSAECH